MKLFFVSAETLTKIPSGVQISNERKNSAFALCFHHSMKYLSDLDLDRGIKDTAQCHVIHQAWRRVH